MHIFLNLGRILTLSLILSTLVSYSQHPESKLPKSYNVIWDSPSQAALESMPLSGRKGAGANVWVQDGSFWLYLAQRLGCGF
jgi:hypothetical protein